MEISGVSGKCIWEIYADGIQASQRVKIAENISIFADETMSAMTWYKHEAN